MKIYEIGSIPTSIYDEIGGKARGLDWLKKNNFNVAEGFVVTDLESLDDIDKKEILEYFEKMHLEKVSVRSSASSEDGDTFSSAGQFETYLDVSKEDLLNSIQKCVESLNDLRGKTYNSIFNNKTHVKMNVVVEKMVNSKFSGVTFSTSPLYNDKILIEALEGKGEDLVSGTKKSSQFYIDKNKFDFSGEKEVLNQDKIKEIYENTLKISKEFKNEVDLEWSIDDKNELYWLQVRPITTLDTTSIHEFDTKNKVENHLITKRNIGEMMPGAVTPLSISTSVLAIDYGIRNMARRIGCIKKNSDLPDYFMAFSYCGHLFIDMTDLHILSKSVALASPTQMNLSILGETYPDYPEIEGKKRNGILRFFNSFRFLSYLMSSKKEKKKLDKIIEECHFKNNDDYNEIYKELTEKMHYMNEALCCHYVCSSYSGMMNSAMYETLKTEFENKTDYQAFQSKALSNIEGIESADILKMLQKLSKLILIENKNAINLSEEELYKFIINNKNEEIVSTYNSFIKKHGHRSIKEAELRSKAWKNDQISLMKYLKVILRSDYEIKEDKFELKPLIKDFKSSIRSALNYIIPNARQAVIDREYSKSRIIKVIDRFKDQYIKLSIILKENKIIPDEDLIYFLTHKEIGDLINGDNSLIKKAFARKNVFNEQIQFKFNDICIGAPTPIEEDNIEYKTELKGIPVSKGKVIGKAHIIKSFDEANTIEKGEIMIVEFTDIGWSPYYSLASALITEVGSALSHGAVVAREYSLPTIVNVTNATSIIKNGDNLLVDSTLGTVKILSQEEYDKLNK